MVKKFLDENTVSKISINKVGSDKWQEAMFAQVSRDIIPKCFGGTLVDELDDPECKTKVCCKAANEMQLSYIATFFNT